VIADGALNVPNRVSGKRLLLLMPTASHLSQERARTFADIIFDPDIHLSGPDEIAFAERRLRKLKGSAGRRCARRKRNRRWLRPKFSSRRVGMVQTSAPAELHQGRVSGLVSKEKRRSIKRRSSTERDLYELCFY